MTNEEFNKIWNDSKASEQSRAKAFRSLPKSEQQRIEQMEHDSRAFDDLSQD